MRPVVSVVTVVKNDDIGLKKTLESLATLIDHGIEIIVVDSSDVPISFYNKSINGVRNIKVVYQAARGIYPAMNEGASYCSGDWVWFLNAGDEAECEADELLEILNNAIDFSGIAFAVKVVTSSGKIRDIVWPTFKINSITQKVELHTNHQGFLFARSKLPDTPYNLEFKYAADTELIDKIANSEEIFISDTTIAKFYINGTSGKNYLAVLKELLEIRPQRKTVKFYLSIYTGWLKTKIRQIIF